MTCTPNPEQPGKGYFFNEVHKRREDRMGADVQGKQAHYNANRGNAGHIYGKGAGMDPIE